MMVAPRLQEPLLVIAQQADDLGGDLPSKRENRVDAFLCLRTAVNVVAEEDDHVPVGRHGSKLGQEIIQRGKVAMDIADCNRRHWRGACISRSPTGSHSTPATGDGEDTLRAVGRKSRRLTADHTEIDPTPRTK